MKTSHGKSNLYAALYYILFEYITQPAGNANVLSRMGYSVLKLDPSFVYILTDIKLLNQYSNHNKSIEFRNFYWFYSGDNHLSPILHIHNRDDAETSNIKRSVRRIEKKFQFIYHIYKDVPHVL